MTSKLYSVEELDRLVRDEFGWRRKEIIDFEALLLGAKGTNQGMLARVAIALVYSHWEGFVKQASEKYVNFVRTKGLKKSKLSPGFLSLSLRSDLMALTEKATRHHRNVEICRRYTSGMSEPASIPSGEIIDTKSNLGLEVFCDICLVLGIDHLDFHPESMGLDSLLEERNKIAHGRWTSVRVDDARGRMSSMLLLMERFGDKIVRAAERDEYLIH